MSSDKPMPETRDCGGDVAAYVLGSLEPGEAETFRRHLDECIVCRDEVLAFQQVVDALPMAAPQQPVPRALRRRVLGQVHEEARAAKPARGRGLVAWPRPALAAAGLAAAALAVFGGVELAGTGSSPGHGSRAGTRVFAASVGRAQLRVTGGHAELVVDHLPPPRPGHIYEVWLKRNGEPATATKTLFSVTSSGSGDVDVPGSLKGFNTVMVTQEPDGGSPYPTTRPVIVTPLA